MSENQNMIAQNSVGLAGSPDELRRVRVALQAAIDNGADYFRDLHNLVEDELIAALNRRRKELER